jgi:hypothetical protein
MNKEEKKIKSRQFIASSKFTPATSTALALFNRNVQNLFYVFNLEGVLLEKVVKGEIDIGLPADAQIEAKNFIVLDGLAKIMMVAEGFFALCEAISNPRKGYKYLARSMARYSNSEIKNFIKRFKKREVNLWTLFRFPDLAKLKLEPEELVFIEKKFNDSCRLFEKTIAGVVDFYECNRIPYNKLKHGLSILSGMKLTRKDGPVEGEFPSVLIYALDRKGDRKPQCLCYRSRESFMSKGLEWYDTVSIIPYWQNTFKKYSGVMSDLLKMIEHLTHNHLNWASNCGEDFFPLKWVSKGKYTPILYLPYKPKGSDKELYGRIVNKIMSNMNIADKTYKFDINIPEKVMSKIFGCFAVNQVATIWAPTSSKSVTSVKIE